MALSVVLIVGAVLIGRTFLRLRAIDVGYRAEQVLAFDVPQPSTRYPHGADSRRFANQLLPRLAALPGARRAAAVLLRPMWGVVGMDWPITVEGQSPADALQNPLVNLEAVSSGYFDTLGIRMVDGRDFDDRDREGNPPVAVVSQGFARRFWGAGPALGRRIRFPLVGSPYHRQWFTIVGIVGDAKYRELQGSRLDLYLSSNQYPDAFHQFVVRADGDPALLVNAIRAEVRAIDPELPVDDAVVLKDAVDQQVASPRFTAAIFVAFAATATALAALGLGTLIAWQVRQRTREIGIRVALGAQPRAVVRGVMGDAAFIVAAGVAAGLAAAAAAATLLRALLYEVGPHDPWSMAGAALVAAIAGLGSAYFPARRAMRIDPMVALREE
jgi:putative ABC transport system permease protein